MEGVCSFCKRYSDDITKHHLIPKTLHTKLRKKKKYKRTEMKKTVVCCKNCHHHVHTVFSNNELERCYNTYELLLNSNEMQKFIKFIQKKKSYA